MKVVLGADHAGVALRQRLAAALEEQGHEVRQVGARDETAFDYPAASDDVACAVRTGEATIGVLICGSGIGVAIRANRYTGIRAAVCRTPEEAETARQHNHANVLCLGARTLEASQAETIVRAFLSTGPDPAERHVRRVAMLDGNVDCTEGVLMEGSDG